MNRNLLEDIQSIIKEYENKVKGINGEARDSNDRAYGGIIRSEEVITLCFGLKM